MIKALPTEHNGITFRSRTEARWAVFFDALGVRYEYEIEGFDLCEHGYYLPDFWIPRLDLFIEIKPSYLDKTRESPVQALVFATGKNVCVFKGNPQFGINVGNFLPKYRDVEVGRLYFDPTKDCNWKEHEPYIPDWAVKDWIGHGIAFSMCDCGDLFLGSGGGLKKLCKREQCTKDNEGYSSWLLRTACETALNSFKY